MVNKGADLAAPQLPVPLFSHLHEKAAPCADPGIFVRGGGGGVPGQSDKKSSDNFFFFFFFFLVLSLFYRSQMVNLSFFNVPEGGPTFSRGSNFFLSRGGGGGSNCVFPIDTHITCDFPGGSGPPVPPPLEPHLSSLMKRVICKLVESYIKSTL